MLEIQSITIDGGLKSTKCHQKGALGVYFHGTDKGHD